MNMLFEPGTKPKHLDAAIGRCLAQYPETAGLLLLAAAGNDYDELELDALLREQDVPLAGGIFDQIVYADQHYEYGVLIVALDRAPSITAVAGLDDYTVDYSALLTALDDRQGGDAMVVFADDTTAGIGALVAALFDRLGPKFDGRSPASSSLSLKPTDCVMTNHGILRDVAVLVALESAAQSAPLEWSNYLSGPLQVTEAHGNEIVALDGRPAYQVYHEILARYAKEPASSSTFASDAQRHPLGLNVIGQEYSVRSPLAVGNGGTLICNGTIPVDAMVDVLVCDGAAGEQDRLQSDLRTVIDTAVPTATVFVDGIELVRAGLGGRRM